MHFDAHPFDANPHPPSRSLLSLAPLSPSLGWRQLAAGEVRRDIYPVYNKLVRGVTRSADVQVPLADAPSSPVSSRRYNIDTHHPATMLHHA